MIAYCLQRAVRPGVQDGVGGGGGGGGTCRLLYCLGGFHRVYFSVASWIFLDNSLWHKLPIPAEKK